MAMIYADVSLEAGASVPFDADYDERAIYTVAGEIDIAEDLFEPGQLLVFRPGDRITVGRIQRGSAHVPRRRAHGRPALHLVEFRVVP